MKACRRRRSIGSRQAFKTQDLKQSDGRARPGDSGLGKVVRQNASVGVSAGINALGKEAMLEGKKARAFPLALRRWRGVFRVAEGGRRFRRCFETARPSKVVIRGLDPRIHHSSREDGLPDQVRQ